MAPMNAKRIEELRRLRSRKIRGDARKTEAILVDMERRERSGVLYDACVAFGANAIASDWQSIAIGSGATVRKQ